MKTKILDKTGRAGKELDLPKCFSSKIRPDILAKVFEAQKLINSQSYGAKEGAGAQYSASGIIKHKRHDWKSSYNKGISRIPRKIMSRNGSSFNWVGATVSNTRGGRRPHAPRSAKNPFSKINKKELTIAFTSAFSATFDQKSLEKIYNKKVTSGVIFDDKILTLKTKEFLATLKSVLGDGFETAVKKRKIRAGIGKMRGRKYKKSAGLIFVISDEESMKRKGIDVVSVSDLRIMDLAPSGNPGRLACYTENAIKQIAERFK